MDKKKILQLSKGINKSKSTLPKTTILTPCYNGEMHIDRYMASVLEQTYVNIELIIVNDGSSDKSEEIILSYQKKIEEAGIVFKYIKKANGGQPSAINAGLPRVSGKYLTWVDIDDYMHADYIEKKVLYFENNPDMDLLISKCAVYKMLDLQNAIWFGWADAPITNEELINMILSGNGYTYVPGCFMVKMSFYDHINSDRKIYDGCKTWSGPQIQLQLPMIFYGNIGYTTECLFDYYIHENNHHNSFKTKENIIRKSKEMENVYFETIKLLSLPSFKKEEYIKTYKIHISKIRLDCALAFRDKKLCIDAKNELKKYKGYHLKEKVKAIIVKSDFLYWFYKAIKPFKRN